MSARRRQRYWSEMDSVALLKALGACRAACVAANSKAPIGEPVYKGSSAVMATIDDLAGVLTGDREYFWLKPAPASQMR
jgi:hypothetical protein